MRRFVVPKCHVCRPKLVPRLWGRGSVLLIPLPMPGSCARAGFQSPHRRLVSLLAFWSKLPPDFICQLNLQEFLARFSVRHNLDHLASLLTHALLLSPLVTGICWKAERSFPARRTQSVNSGTCTASARRSPRRCTTLECLSEICRKCLATNH